LRDYLSSQKIKLKKKKKNKSSLTLYREYVKGDYEWYSLFPGDDSSGPDGYSERIRLSIRILMWIHIYKKAREERLSCATYLRNKIGEYSADVFSNVVAMDRGDHSEKVIFSHFTNPDGIMSDLGLFVYDTSFTSREVTDREVKLRAHCDFYAGIPSGLLYGERLSRFISEIGEPDQAERICLYAWSRNIDTVRSTIGKILKQYLGEQDKFPLLEEIIKEQSTQSKEDSLPCTYPLIYPGEGRIISLESLHNGSWSKVYTAGKGLHLVDIDINNAAKESLNKAIDIVRGKVMTALDDLHKVREELLLIKVFGENHVTSMGEEFGLLSEKDSICRGIDRKTAGLARRLRIKYSMPDKTLRKFLSGKVSLIDFAEVAVQTCPKYNEIFQYEMSCLEDAANYMHLYTTNRLLLAALRKLQEFEQGQRGDLFNGLADAIGLRDVVMKSPAPAHDLSSAEVSIRRSDALRVSLGGKDTADAAVVAEVYPLLKKGTAAERLKGRFGDGHVRRRR
jgi:hypothetical protein